MQSLALIGFGAIARSLLKILCAQGSAAPMRLIVMVRPGREDEAMSAARRICGGQVREIQVEQSIEAVLEARPDLVVECAGSAAVASCGKAVLEAGHDLIIASTGALHDEDLLAELGEAARSSGAQLIIPSGAIGGIDALAAARLSELQEVVYTGRKPPFAWKGSPAEAAINLNELAEPATFFEGSAREAAKAYPKNANVAATLALAGMGMDATRVRLVADPTATENTHEFSVRSSVIDTFVRLSSKASADNPKTSQSTAFSLARAVLNRSAGIAI